MKPYPTRTCPECRLLYEHDPDREVFPCPWCSDIHVGIGPDMNGACRNAMKKLLEAGSSDRIWQVTDHVVYLVDLPESRVRNQLMHRVRLGLKT